MAKRRYDLVRPKPSKGLSRIRAGQEAITDHLVKLGIPARLALKTVAAVFAAWKNALIRGESVETPLGTLSVVKSRPEVRIIRNRFSQYNPSTKTMDRKMKLLRINHRPYTIRFSPNQDLNLND